MFAYKAWPHNTSCRPYCPVQAEFNSKLSELIRIWVYYACWDGIARLSGAGMRNCQCLFFATAYSNAHPRWHGITQKLPEISLFEFSSQCGTLNFHLPLPRYFFIFPVFLILQPSCFIQSDSDFTNHPISEYPTIRMSDWTYLWREDRHCAGSELLAGVTLITWCFLRNLYAWHLFSFSISLSASSKLIVGCYLIFSYTKPWSDISLSKPEPPKPDSHQVFSSYNEY